MQQQDLMNFLTGGFVYISVGFVIFFILREFWCWYFKVNRIVELLEQIEENTRPIKPETSSNIKEEVKPGTNNFV